MKILVSDTDQTHANTCKSYIEAECPTATVETYIFDIDDSVTYAIANDFNLISRSTTGLSDARNEGAGNTAWESDVSGAFDVGFSNGFDSIKHIGIVHALGSNSYERDVDPSRIDIICAVGQDTDDELGSYGTGLEFCHLTEATQSYSTAKVAGMIGQLMVDHPTWNFHDARAALRQTADDYNTGWTEATGFGEVDADAATAVTTLAMFSPTRKTVTSSDGSVVFTWVNSYQTDFSSTVIAMYNSKPYRGQKPITSEIIYDGVLETYTYEHELNETKYFAFYSKDTSGNYSLLEDNVEPGYNYDIYQTLLTSTPTFDNKIFKAIYEIKDALEELSEFKFVGEYPADVPRAITSGNSPCLLVQEGDEISAGIDFNTTQDKAVDFSVWMYHDGEKSRIETLTDLQLLIEQTMLSSTLLASSQAFCIQWDSVEKGEHLEDFDGYSVGYSNKKGLRRINFKIIVQIER